jgi:microcystin-dependent protein
MSQPYVGEIRMVGFNFAPQGWAFCNGQQLAIAENDVLFQLIGTTYGGDGVQTFNLPDLRGRVPIHQGQGTGLSNRIVGQFAGVETVTLTVQQIPSHTHVPNANVAVGSSASPAGNFWAERSGTNQYITGAPNGTMNAACLQNAGGTQPHDNILPFQVINFVISLFGVFPSQ